MSSTDAVPIAVTSDRSLVAEAVSAALAGSNFAIVRVPWPGTCLDQNAGWSPDLAPPALGLMLCDLEPSSVQAARWLVGRYPTRWLLLTDAPRGPLWGAMLEVGVAGILVSSTRLVDLLETISALRDDMVEGLPSDRDELVEAWRRDEAERADLQARMTSLSPRELEVLRLLHLGHTVHQIADLHDVAPSTVRSQVRAVLRKLGVNSQLAAVARFGQWLAL